MENECMQLTTHTFRRSTSYWSCIVSRGDVSNGAVSDIRISDTDAATDGATAPSAAPLPSVSATAPAKRSSAMLRSSIGAFCSRLRGNRKRGESSARQCAVCTCAGWLLHVRVVVVYA